MQRKFFFRQFFDGIVKQDFNEMTFHEYIEKRSLRDRDIRWILLLIISVFTIAVISSQSINFRIDITTWHYTLSTIVQSLAAILAMGGAFFIFKIPQIDKEIEDYRNRIIHFLSIEEGTEASTYYDYNNKELSSAFLDHVKNFQAKGNLTELFNKYERIKLVGDAQKKALENWFELLDKFIDKKEDINKFLKKSFEYIGATIVVSILLLMGSPLFFNTSFNDLILAVPVSLFVVGTYYIATAILKVSI